MIPAAAAAAPDGCALTLVLLANAVLGFSRGAWGTLRFAPDLAARVVTRFERLTHDLTKLHAFDRVILLRSGPSVALERRLLEAVWAKHDFSVLHEEMGGDAVAFVRELRGWDEAGDVR